MKTTAAVETKILMLRVQKALGKVIPQGWAYTICLAQTDGLNGGTLANIPPEVSVKFLREMLEKLEAGVAKGETRATQD